MIHLLKKDLLIQKKSFLFFFVFSFFMFIIFNDPEFNSVIYIMGMIIAVYIFLFTASMEDEKNRSEIILNSLPLPRSRLVLAKYLSVLVYILIGAVFLGIVGLLFQLPVIPLTPRLLSITDMLIAGFIISIYVSIYFPLQFRFGASTLRLFNVIFFLFFFFIPRYLSNLYLAHEEAEAVRFLQSFLLEHSPLTPAAIAGIFALLLLTGSFLLSRRIYLHREF
jgi:ABC-2 type transport system permease protein